MKKISGEIGFDGKEIVCTIGVHPIEKIKPQTLIVDLRVNATFSSSDSFNEVIDYMRLASLCEEIAHKTHFHLIETYAEQVLKALFAEFPLISSAWIRVRKPSVGAVIEVRGES